MKLGKTLLSLAAAAVMASTAPRVVAEELSVATFIPPQHHINSFYFDWLGKELKERSGGSLTIKVYVYRGG